MAGDLDPIAVWGAIAGTLALGVQAITFLADRPRLVAVYRNEHPDAKLAITNTGRRPIALQGAGIFIDRVDWRYRMRRLLRRSKRIRLAVPIHPVDAPPVVIQPGESWVVNRPMPDVLALIDGLALIEPDQERGLIGEWPTEIYVTTPTGRTLTWPVTVPRGENIAQLTEAIRGTVTLKPGAMLYPLDGGRPIPAERWGGGPGSGGPPDPLITRGMELEAVERYGEALACYDRLIERHVDLPRALLARGGILLRTGRYDDALGAYDRTLELQPDNAGALMNRGLTLAALNRYDEALADHDRALAVLPNNADVLASRGKALAALKRYDEALADYRHAVDLRPDDVDLIVELAIAFRDGGRPLDALELLGSTLGLSFLAGIRLYLTVLALGLGIRFGVLHPPESLHGLGVLAHTPVLAIAA